MFVRENTVAGHASLVPELVLRLATGLTPLWQATEDFLRRQNIAPPFWAFAWPGGQALARLILDEPARVAGRRVLDFAAGGGIAALAAARAGAASVEAADIDPLATAATAINATANDLAVQTITADIVGRAKNWDLIVCGDVCYEAPMTRHVLPWLQAMAGEGAEVWLADPGRAYLPTTGLKILARYEVPTSLDLEDRLSRTTTLYRLDRV